MALEQTKSKNPFIRHAALAVGSWVPAAFYDGIAEGWIVASTPLLSLLTIPLWVGFLYPAVILGLFFSPKFSGILIENSDLLFEKAATFIATSLPPFSISLWGLIPALLLFVAPKAFRASWFWWAPAGILFLRLGLWHLDMPTKPLASEVSQLDVGQGDSARIRFETGPLNLKPKLALIDTGLPGKLKPDQWMDKLKLENGFGVESVLLTHLDQDHAGGMPSLKVLTRIQSIGPEGFPFFSVEVLSRKKSGNSRMNAVAVELTNRKLYLNAGDSDQSQELLFLSRLKKEFRDLRERAVILKLSHHGSRFSSNAQFLKTLHPEKVWISVGRGNTYGHPTYEALIRVGETDAETERTDQKGDLSVRSGFRAEAFRHR
jgi:competence protein ComEC